MLYIELKSLAPDSELYFYNSLGQLIHIQTIADKTVCIDLDSKGISKGLYIIEVCQKNGISFKSRFVYAK